MKQRYTKRNERGITLTSLIITVILLLILAAVGIGTMSADGLFGHASYATFAQNMRNYEEKVGVYVIKEQEKQNYRYDINIYDKATMKEIVSDFTDEQAEQYVIQDNELKYRAEKVDSTERKWLEELGISAMLPLYTITFMGKEGVWKTIQSHKIVYPSELPNDDEILYTGWYYDEQTTQLAKEGTILNENTTLYTGFIRYYIVDEAIYCNTLTEALEIAQDGSTIKLLRDIEETESITIDKSITINTNGKTINFADGRRIYINENKNVVIEGNGTLTVNSDSSFISNYGNLVTNDVTIHRKSSYYSSQYGTINNSGNFTTNRCTISDITGEGITYINEGEYESLAFIQGGGTAIINDATIEEINLRIGGTVKINGGIIKLIVLMDNGNSIYLDIGNLNESVSTTNPVIERMYFQTDLASILLGTEINFYNGVVKEYDGMYVDVFDSFYTSLRSGYQTQTTTEGTILVPSN